MGTRTHEHIRAVGAVAVSVALLAPAVLAPACGDTASRPDAAEFPEARPDGSVSRPDAAPDAPPSEFVDSQKLKGSGGSHFGRAVAMTAGVIIVGAPWTERIAEPSTENGAAYVYEPDETGGWQLVQILVASDISLVRKFGICTAVSEATIVVCSESIGGVAGAAYLFERDVDGTWIEVQKLVTSGGATGDGFGRGGVAFAGSTLVVGLVGTTSSATPPGPPTCSSAPTRARGPRARS